MLETWARSLGCEDNLEKEMATRSCTLAWKIPWTEKPGRLQSMGLQSRTRLSNLTFTFCSAIPLGSSEVSRKIGPYWEQERLKKIVSLGAFKDLLCDDKRHSWA